LETQKPREENTEIAVRGNIEQFNKMAVARADLLLLPEELLEAVAYLLPDLEDRCVFLHEDVSIGGEEAKEIQVERE
jgi:hypothetical protein